MRPVPVYLCVICMYVCMMTIHTYIHRSIDYTPVKLAARRRFDRPYDENKRKDDIYVDGKVEAVERSLRFKVSIGKKVINCLIGGHLNRSTVRIKVGDHVRVVISGSDLEIGRIVYRHKSRPSEKLNSITHR